MIQVDAVIEATRAEIGKRRDRFLVLHSWNPTTDPHGRGGVLYEFWAIVRG